MRTQGACSTGAIRPESSEVLKSSWPLWFVVIVIIGALLTATGAVMALLPSSEHLNIAGRNYAEYFATRNLAVAAMLLVMLALRLRSVLAGLMVLTAFVQLLDVVTAAATARTGLIPIDVVFAAVFLIGASRLLGQPVWRGTAWHHRTAGRLSPCRCRQLSAELLAADVQCRS